jgi:hypothetical protein
VGVSGVLFCVVPLNKSEKLLPVFETGVEIGALTGVIGLLEPLNKSEKEDIIIR